MMIFINTSGLAISAVIAALACGTQAQALTCLDDISWPQDNLQSGGMVIQQVMPNMVPQSFEYELKKFGTAPLQAYSDVMPLGGGVPGQPGWTCQDGQDYLENFVDGLLTTSGNPTRLKWWQKQVIGQGIDGNGSPISLYPGFGWRPDHENPWINGSRELGVQTDMVAASMNGEQYEPNDYKEVVWKAVDLDPEGIVDQMRAKHRAAQADLLALGFKAARQATVGVAFFEINRFTVALQKSPEDLLEGAFDVEEALRPTIEALEETNVEIKKAHKESADARRKEKYYSAEIGSDQRPTNLSYEMAEDGYTYERRLPDEKFIDGHGNVHETEVYQLPAKNIPDVPVEEPVV